jgi:hypothetical protein
MHSSPAHYGVNVCALCGCELVMSRHETPIAGMLDRAVHDQYTDTRIAQCIVRAARSGEAQQSVSAASALPQTAEECTASDQRNKFNGIEAATVC